jgi:hypothetical protein
MIPVANLPALRKMRMIPVAMQTGVRFALSVELCEPSVCLCVIKLRGDTQSFTEAHRAYNCRYKAPKFMYASQGGLRFLSIIMTLTDR